MTRELTTAAKCAAMIRNALKSTGLKARVTSKNFSMGNSVHIHLTDARPEIVTLVRQLAAKFQYGHFDAMSDCYEVSSMDETTPQAKFVHVTNHVTNTAQDWGSST